MILGQIEVYYVTIDNNFKFSSKRQHDYATLIAYTQYELFGTQQGNNRIIKEKLLSLQNQTETNTIQAIIYKEDIPIGWGYVKYSKTNNKIYECYTYILNKWNNEMVQHKLTSSIIKSIPSSVIVYNINDLLNSEPLFEQFIKSLL